MTRDDEAECFDPGFLTIFAITPSIALPIGERERGGCRPQQAAADALARSRYASPLTSMAQRIRAVLAASATITTL